MKEKLKSIPLLMVALIITGSIFIFGFSKDINKNPITVYRVYLEGKSIGAIKDKKELENYINNEQQELKEKYNVYKIHMPVGLKIRKEITYKDNISTAKDIYEKIKDLKPFTVSGYVIRVMGKEETRINVLEKDMFNKALERVIKAFVTEREYLNYLSGVKKEITNVGKMIENIAVEEERYIKKSNISTDELIFTNVEDLTKYLLFGTLEEQSRYIVKLGDTIEKVAYNNSLSIDEFMVANPQFNDVNNLLYEGQEVVVGRNDPKVNVIVMEYVIENRVKEYQTEIRYDNRILVGNNYQLQEGVNGEQKVTQRVTIRNGKIEQVKFVAAEDLKPTINRIYVKGGKLLPSVGDNFWAWPTITPYVITSPFGPRWGTLHDAVDIASVYGSPIYAANNGTIYKVYYDHRGGNQVIINHNNNYYTVYAHLASISAKKGQVVQRGQQIGTMGNTGHHPITGKRVGTHLHFGIYVGVPYVGGYAINPLRMYR